MSWLRWTRAQYACLGLWSAPGEGQARELFGLVLGGQCLLGAADFPVEIGQRALGGGHRRPFALIGLQDRHRRVVPAGAHQGIEMDGAEQRALRDAAADRF